MTLFDNKIDCVNHRVINVLDPVDETDVVNKKYVDALISTPSKNYVGLIPENPQRSGFTFIYMKNDNTLDETIYNLTLNNDTLWRSDRNTLTFIDIETPYDVKIWGLYLQGGIARFRNGNRTRNINIRYRDRYDNPRLVQGNRLSPVYIFIFIYIYLYIYLYIDT